MTTTTPPTDPTSTPSTPQPPNDASTPNKNLVQGGPEWWRRTFVYMTGMGLTDAEKAKWEADYRLKKAADECKRCEEWKEFSLNYSPIVRFLRENVSKLGGTLDSANIICSPCDTVRAGGFSPNAGILLCSNYLMSKTHAEDTLAHELVHAWDHLRFKVDWGNIRHHACSEIRASSLSGECRWTRETLTRGIWDYTAHHQECVRRRAALSVRAHPDCRDEEHAKKVVNEVFDSCFADTRPFDEIYR